MYTSACRGLLLADAMLYTDSVYMLCACSAENLFSDLGSPCRNVYGLAAASLAFHLVALVIHGLGEYIVFV